MGRYTGPVCRLCRAQGEKLYLKHDKCYTDKCPFERRSYAPGQHGQARKKLSDYGIHLKEKQKVRRIYGVMERQFRRFFDMASREKGVTGETFLQILERRLDNVVYRLGWAYSRKHARQIVSHGHITVNGRKVNIPSFLVKAGDVIEVKESSKSKNPFKEIREKDSVPTVPGWLDLDFASFKAKVLGLPTRDQIDVPVDESLIVEFYSR